MTIGSELIKAQVNVKAHMRHTEHGDVQVRQHNTTVDKKALVEAMAQHMGGHENIPDHEGLHAAIDRAIDQHHEAGGRVKHIRHEGGQWRTSNTKPAAAPGQPMMHVGGGKVKVSVGGEHKHQEPLIQGAPVEPGPTPPPVVPESAPAADKPAPGSQAATDGVDKATHEKNKAASAKIQADKHAAHLKGMTDDELSSDLRFHEADQTRRNEQNPKGTITENGPSDQHLAARDEAIDRGWKRGADGKIGPVDKAAIKAHMTAAAAHTRAAQFDGVATKDAHGNFFSMGKQHLDSVVKEGHTQLDAPAGGDAPSAIAKEKAGTGGADPSAKQLKGRLDRAKSQVDQAQAAHDANPTQAAKRKLSNMRSIHNQLKEAHGVTASGRITNPAATANPHGFAHATGAAYDAATVAYGKNPNDHKGARAAADAAAEAHTPGSSDTHEDSIRGEITRAHYNTTVAGVKPANQPATNEHTFNAAAQDEVKKRGGNSVYDRVGGHEMKAHFAAGHTPSQVVDQHFPESTADKGGKVDPSIGRGGVKLPPELYTNNPKTPAEARDLAKKMVEHQTKHGGDSHEDALLHVKDHMGAIADSAHSSDEERSAAADAHNHLNTNGGAAYRKDIGLNLKGDRNKQKIRDGLANGTTGLHRDEDEAIKAAQKAADHTGKRHTIIDHEGRFHVMSSDVATHDAYTAEGGKIKGAVAPKSHVGPTKVEPPKPEQPKGGARGSDSSRTAPKPDGDKLTPDEVKKFSNTMYRPGSELDAAKAVAEKLHQATGHPHSVNYIEHHGGTLIVNKHDGNRAHPGHQYTSTGKGSTAAFDGVAAKQKARDADKDAHDAKKKAKANPGGEGAKADPKPPFKSDRYPHSASMSDEDLHREHGKMDRFHNNSTIADSKSSGYGDERAHLKAEIDKRKAAGSYDPHAATKARQVAGAKRENEAAKVDMRHVGRLPDSEFVKEYHKSWNRVAAHKEARAKDGLHGDNLNSTVQQTHGQLMDEANRRGIYTETTKTGKNPDGVNHTDHNLYSKSDPQGFTMHIGAHQVGQEPFSTEDAKDRAYNRGAAKGDRKAGERSGSGRSSDPHGGFHGSTRGPSGGGPVDPAAAKKAEKVAKVKHLMNNAGTEGERVAAKEAYARMTKAIASFKKAIEAGDALAIAGSRDEMRKSGLVAYENGGSTIFEVSSTNERMGTYTPSATLAKSLSTVDATQYNPGGASEHTPAAMRTGYEDGASALDMAKSLAPAAPAFVYFGGGRFHVTLDTAPSPRHHEGRGYVEIMKGGKEALTHFYDAAGKHQTAQFAPAHLGFSLT